MKLRGSVEMQKRTWKKFGYGAGIVLLSIAIAGCGSAIAPANQSKASNAQPNNTQASKPKVVGIVDIVESDPLNVKLINGVTAAAKAKGWTVKVFDANGSADAANSAMRNYVNQKVGAIVDLAFPVSSIGAGLNAAYDAHIPVGGWGSGLGPGIVVTTKDDLGQPSAEALLQAMGGTSGKGSVLGLYYNGGAICRERQAVVDKVLATAPGVKFQKQQLQIPGDLTQGTNYTTAWLAGHPNGSGNLAVWGCWDDPMYGAVSAVKQAGRTDVKTFSLNGAPPALQDVADGSITNESWEDGYKEGQVIFNTILESINAGSSWKPKTVTVPGVILTSANIKSFLAAHPDALH